MSQPDPNRPKIAIDPRMLIASIGILLAPFVGLLYSAEVALGILTVCLGVVAWFAWQLSQQLPANQRGMLRVATIANGLLALAALGLLITRL